MKAGCWQSSLTSTARLLEWSVHPVPEPYVTTGLIWAYSKRMIKKLQHWMFGGDNGQESQIKSHFGGWKGNSCAIGSLPIQVLCRQGIKVWDKNHRVRLRYVGHESCFWVFSVVTHMICASFPPALLTRLGAMALDNCDTNFWIFVVHL